MRETHKVTIQDKEQTLNLVVTEMPALEGAIWLGQATMLLAKSGVMVPDGADLGEAAESLTTGSALMGLFKSLQWDEIEPLLMSLFKYVSRVPDGGLAPQSLADPTSINAIVQSPLTIFQIAMEVVKINFGFFMPRAMAKKNGIAEVSKASGTPQKITVPPKPTRTK